MNMFRNRGVTLTDTMLAVAIMAMFAVIAFPSFTSSEKYQLDLAVQEIRAAIGFARNEALRTGDVYGVDIDRTTNQFTIYKADLTATPVAQEFIAYHPINKNLYDYNLNTDFNLSNIKITNTTEPFLFTDSVRRNSLLFTGNGNPVWIDSSSGAIRQLVSGSLRLAINSRINNLNIEPYSGRVTMQ